MGSEVPPPRSRTGGRDGLKILGDAYVPGFEPKRTKALNPNPNSAVVFVTEFGVVFNHPGESTGWATVHPSQSGFVPGLAPVGAGPDFDCLARGGRAGGEDESRQNGGQDNGFHFGRLL